MLPGFNHQRRFLWAKSPDIATMWTKKSSSKVVKKKRKTKRK